MKLFIQQKINEIMVRLFGSIPYPEIYKYKKQKEKSGRLIAFSIKNFND